MGTRLGTILTENALWMMASDIVKAGMGFIVLFLVIKLGGIALYGTYRAIISLSAVMSVFLNFGLETSLLKYLSDEEKSSFFTAAIILRIFPSILLIAVVSFTSDILGKIIGINGWTIFIASLLTVFSILPIFRSLFTATLSVFEYFKTVLLGYSLMVALTASFLVIGLGLEGLLLAYVIHNLVILLLLTLKSLYIIKLSVPSIKHVKSILFLGLSIWMPLIFNVLGRYSAEIFLFAFSGSIQTGRYSVAFAIMTLTTMPLTPVAQLLIPNLEKYSEKERPSVLAKVTEIEYEILSPLLGILLLLSDELMSFLSANGGILRILLISTLLIPLTMTNSIFLVRNESKVMITLRGIFASSIKLVLYYLLTPVWGGLGAAFSYTLGEIAKGPIEFHLIRRYKIPINWIKIFILVLYGLTPLLLYSLKRHIILTFLYVFFTIILYRFLPLEDRHALRMVITTPLRILRRN